MKCRKAARATAVRPDRAHFKSDVDLMEWTEYRSLLVDSWLAGDLAEAEGYLLPMARHEGGRRAELRATLAVARALDLSVPECDGLFDRNGRCAWCGEDLYDHAHVFAAYEGSPLVEWTRDGRG